VAIFSSHHARRAVDAAAATFARFIAATYVERETSKRAMTIEKRRSVRNAKLRRSS